MVVWICFVTFRSIFIRSIPVVMGSIPSRSIFIHSFPRHRIFRSRPSRGTRLVRSRPEGQVEARDWCEAGPSVVLRNMRCRDFFQVEISTKFSRFSKSPLISHIFGSIFSHFVSPNRHLRLFCPRFFSSLAKIF